VRALRHAAASRALAAGGTLAAVSKRLGHSSPRLTLGIYLHSEPAHDAEAALDMASGVVLLRAKAERRLEKLPPEEGPATPRRAAVARTVPVAPADLRSKGKKPNDITV